MLRRQLLGCAALLPLMPAWQRAAAAPTGGDIDFLLSVFERIHPGLHRYADQAAIGQAAAALRAGWWRAPDVPARYLALSRFLSVIRCGHTYANFFNQDAALFKQVYRDEHCFPLPFQWAGATMIATADVGGIARGSRITAVNGVPAAAILRAMTPFVRVDGDNDAMRRALLSASGADSIETFDVFYQLLFGRPEAFVVDFVGPDGRLAMARLRPIAAAARKPAAAHGAAVDGPSLWPLTDKGKGVFHLRMTGWAVYNGKWDWRAYLAGVFERLQAERATGLVVDIRDNEGGLDCGDEIIARLIDRPLDVAFWDRFTRYRRFPDEFRPWVSTWDDRFYDWGGQVVPAADGFFRFVANEESRIEPAGPRFRGKVVVLTDASNHSATLRFAMIAKRQQLATLVGEATGGSQRGVNGGAFFFVKLPDSGIEVDLPLIAYMPKFPLPAAGVQPDVLASLQAAALARGIDHPLETALRQF